MAKNEKILDIVLNEVKFSHGELCGAISLLYNEITFLNGENGAGKTSFIQYLKHNKLNLFNRDVFFIEQDQLSAHSNLRGIDLINILKLSAADRFTLKQSWKILELLELDETFLNKEVSYLSGGEKQILKLIIGFCVRADFYILDEPFNNIDKVKRKKLRSFIERSDFGFFIIDHFIDEWSDVEARHYNLSRDGDKLSLLKSYPSGEDV